MKLLNIILFEKWCEAQSIRVTNGKYLYYANACQPLAIEISIPKLAQERLSFACTLLTPEESAAFEGAVLWFKEWDIWSESTEQYAMKIWHNMRVAYSNNEPFRETPGHLFEKNEFVDMQAFFSIPLIFQWDAYLIPSHGNWFAFMSHDEVLYVVARTPDLHNKLLAYFKHWNPKEKLPFYMK